MRIPQTAATFVAVVTGVIAAFAVPNEITVGAFSRANGATPEQFFAAPSAWGAKAMPKGDWKRSANNASTMASPGQVFGVNASSIALARNEEGVTTSVIIRYDESSSKLEVQALHEMLVRNIAAFVGAESTASGADLVFKGSELVVSLPAKKSQVLEVVLRRATSPAE